MKNLSIVPISFAVPPSPSSILHPLSSSVFRLPSSILHHLSSIFFRPPSSVLYLPPPSLLHPPSSLFRCCLLSSLLCLLSSCSSEMKRGSSSTLYVIADTLEVGREDFGKNIQLHLDQKLFFNLESDPADPGHWELADYDQHTLLLLNDNPKVSSGFQGFLLQARALGNGFVSLHFVSLADKPKPREVRFEISIRK